MLGESVGGQIKLCFPGKILNFVILLDDGINSTNVKYGQSTLSFLINSRWIWKPWAYKYAFQHDAYSCEVFNNTIGWPTKRLMEPNNFVASVVISNMTLTEKCPVKCRRNPEWEYC